MSKKPGQLQTREPVGVNLSHASGTLDIRIRVQELMEG